MTSSEESDRSPPKKEMPPNAETRRKIRQEKLAKMNDQNQRLAQNLAKIKNLRKITKAATGKNSAKLKKALKGKTVPGKPKEIASSVSELEVSDDPVPIENNQSASDAVVSDYISDLEHQDAAEEQENSDTEEGELDGDTDPIDDFANELENTDATGPDLPPKLAGVISQLLSTHVKYDRQKELMANIKPPGNVPLLKTPRCNNEVWANLALNTKERDSKMAKTQEKMAKVLTLNAEMAAELTKLRENLKGEDKQKTRALTKTALETIQMGAMVMQEISQMRRDRMRFDLGTSVKGLCNTPTEESVKLFGDDIQEKLKELKDVKSIGSQITKKPFLGGSRPKPYDRQQGYTKPHWQNQKSQYPRDQKPQWQNQKSQYQPRDHKSQWQPSYRGEKGNRAHRH
jgi:hypothetical protein